METQTILKRDQLNELIDMKSLFSAKKTIANLMKIGLFR